VRSHRAWAAAVLLTIAAGVAVFPAPVGAQPEDDGDFLDRAGAQNDGHSVTGNAGDEVPGTPVVPPGEESVQPSGPNCTKKDGSRDYLRYEGLQFTTMEEQRTEIRPEEQRPGVYLHVYCGNEYVGFRFYPDVPAGVAVDPRTLADSVTIRPPVPDIRTSPDAAHHLVGVEAWFWVDTWETITRSASAGTVTVTVTAEPTELVVRPGDGSPPFSCVNPPAYDPSAPAAAQSSNCTHVYERAGNHTATVTVVYETSFTSNVGEEGALGNIEPDASVELAVAEAQALNTRG
jgi:hypothetical protein